MIWGRGLRCKNWDDDGDDDDGDDDDDDDFFRILNSQVLDLDSLTSTSRKSPRCMIPKHPFRYWEGATFVWERFFFSGMKYFYHLHFEVSIASW